MEYFYRVKDYIHNPVYGGLTSGDQHLSFGTDTVKFFDPSVSPFAGFEESYAHGFEELYTLLPPGRIILYATPRNLTEAAGWQLLHAIKGLQFMYESNDEGRPHFQPVPLQEEHVPQMVELTTLTNPGPFGPRTIDFGNYFGVFENEKLVAMTGQRLHVQQFTEISAVCTHPDYLGRGYASALVSHQVGLIQQEGQKPFLHVREDNQRAIQMYERLGFVVSGNMNFYVMKRDGE